MAGEYLQGVDRSVRVVTVAGWISGLDLGNVGYIIVGLFVLVRAVASAYWRIAKVEERWTARATDNG